MKKIYLLLFLFSILSLTSCEKQASTSQSLDPNPRKFDDIITLISADTISIPIGQRTNVFSKYISKTSIKGKDYLGLVNENTNQLEFYGLSDDTENFSIKYQQEGPNGVRTIKAFEVLSDSTLLIGSSWRRELYISDFSGNLLNKINSVEKERADRKPYVQIYYTNNPLIYSEKTQSIFTFAIVDQNNYLPGIWSGTYFVEISTLEGNEMKHTLKLPEYLSDLVYGAFFSHSSHLMKGDNQMIISMPYLNDLLVYDLDSEDISYAEAGHSSFGDLLPLENPISEFSERDYINTYREIAYDNETGYLYRFAYEGVDYKDLDGRRRTWDNKKPSIIILDKEMNKVGEYHLPIDQFYTRMYFTHQGKLYVSINHPDNNPSEDELIFVGLKPVDKL
ncbi:DUF4221 family protein [Belliella aquatica]|uniref:DUF4221 domain-containing protein n=1 Tax=Belliella aquatica TaxID=1323734 RepID=A0ABQ1MRK6_9BACT|nr:DUF4221 family protein [Belliella aquatica]MCH7406103.1 DUF4221 domain-containing protein [Belliella aquatica]GGC45168.1 hypothetical protein GCM10010993_24660 [Belliella aquatica]